MSAGADIDRLSTQKKTSSHLLAWNLLFVWFRDSCDTNFRPCLKNHARLTFQFAAVPVVRKFGTIPWRDVPQSRAFKRNLPNEELAFNVVAG